MKSRFGIFMVAISILVGSSYSSFSPFLFVNGVIDGGITCSPQGGGKTYCCASVKDKDNIYGYTTYCTTCDDTNPPSNCTPREKPKAIVNPGKDLSNILEGRTVGKLSTLPDIPGLEGQRANITILSGGILQKDNNLTLTQNETSSNDNNNNPTQSTKSTIYSEEEPTDTLNQKKTINREDQEDSTITGEDTGEKQDSNTS